MKEQAMFLSRFLVVLIGILAGGGAVTAAPSELDLRAQLIWGTDEGRPQGQSLQEVEPALLNKLKGVFKWKDYFETGRQEFKVPVSSRKRVRMSPKCELEVENLGEAGIEVKLFGEGRLVVKKKQVLKAGELLVLAGDDKNNTAWFVVLSTRR